MAERIEYDEQGNRLPADFREPRYAPADMTGINMDAVNANMRNLGVEKAAKAIEAAIQFQGLRGYQQALKNGESPEKAMVKYGPMIFNKQATAFAPSMRAITPPVVKPVVQKPSDVLAREKFEWMKSHPKASPEDYETVSYPGTKAVEGLPAVPGEVKKFLWIDALAKDRPAQPAIPGIPGTPSRTRKVLIDKKATASPTAPPETKQSITKPEYEALKSGDKYWWNGKEYTKK